MVSVYRVFDPGLAMYADVAHLSMHCIAFMYDISIVETNGIIHEPKHFTIPDTEKSFFFPSSGHSPAIFSGLHAIHLEMCRVLPEDSFNILH